MSVKQIMPKIIAWKSEYTGELFEDEREYIRHKRREIRLKKAESRRIKKIKELSDYLNEKLFQRHMSVNEFAEAINNEHDIIWELVKTKDQHLKGNWKITITKINVERRLRVSNTHSCPHNGVTNWHCYENKPRGYPGWYGRIGFEVAEPKGVRYSAFDHECFFKQVRLHLGSGGGGGTQRGYELSIFDADWPGPAFVEGSNKFFKDLKK